MQSNIKTAFQASVALLTALGIAFLCIKAYNAYSEWIAWREEINNWKRDRVEPLVNTVPILTTIVCQHHQEDCFKYVNQKNP